MVVLIGASSGIGRTTAHALARRGDTLVLASRSAAALDDVADECRELAPGRRRRRRRGARQRDSAGSGLSSAHSVIAVPTDVSRREEVDRLFQTAYARFGRVDAVVHAPSVVAYGRFEDVPADVFDQVISVNLLGAANVARTALDRFKDQGSGHLVLVGSLLGKIATPWMSPYVVSKWAVHGLAHTLQVEARTLPGVDVSLVVPGGVDTPIYRVAASYAGRIGRPPPPVDRPERLARAIVRALDRPRLEVSVGLANGLYTVGFRRLPRLYNTIVSPGMARLGVSGTRTENHPGNVFEPVPGQHAVHGEWGRHWLRGVGLAAVLAAAAGARHLARPGSADRST